MAPLNHSAESRAEQHIHVRKLLKTGKNQPVRGVESIETNADDEAGSQGHENGYYNSIPHVQKARGKD